MWKTWRNRIECIFRKSSFDMEIRSLSWDMHHPCISSSCIFYMERNWFWLSDNFIQFGDGSDENIQSQWSLWFNFRHYSKHTRSGSRIVVRFNGKSQNPADLINCILRHYYDHIYIVTVVHYGSPLASKLYPIGIIGIKFPHPTPGPINWINSFRPLYLNGTEMVVCGEMYRYLCTEFPVQSFRDPSAVLSPT